MTPLRRQDMAAWLPGAGVAQRRACRFSSAVAGRQSKRHKSAVAGGQSKAPLKRGCWWAT
ncbi:MAG: hypothetical protein ACRBBJ_14370 [Rhodomicrobiaceae bacterium]